MHQSALIICWYCAFWQMVNFASDVAVTDTERLVIYGGIWQQWRCRACGSCSACRSSFWLGVALYTIEAPNQIAANVFIWMKIIRKFTSTIMSVTYQNQQGLILGTHIPIKLEIFSSKDQLVAMFSNLLSTGIPRVTAGMRSKQTVWISSNGCKEIKN